MMIKNLLPGSFVRLDVNRRTRKSKFFYQIDALIDWAIFEKALHKVCKRSIKDAAGRSAYTYSLGPRIYFSAVARDLPRGSSGVLKSFEGEPWGPGFDMAWGCSTIARHGPWHFLFSVAWVSFASTFFPM